jgi:hypothetical protein
MDNKRTIMCITCRFKALITDNHKLWCGSNDATSVSRRDNGVTRPVNDAITHPVTIQVIYQYTCSFAITSLTLINE